MTASPIASEFRLDLAQRAAGLRGSPIDDLDTLLAGRDDLVPLAGGTPHPDDIPLADIARLAANALSDAPSVLNYGLARGDEELREHLLTFATSAGEGRLTDAQLAVTSGALQGLDILARLFLDPGDVVLAESPTFSDALATFSAYDARVVEVPTDDEGIEVDAIPDVIKRLGRPPRVIYVIPTFQNPGGSEMSVERREALLELADRYRCLVIDDDPYRLLRYEGEEIASLHAFAGERANVVSLRSSSKLIAPGLRIGWALGHQSVISQMVTAKQGMDVSTSNLNQRIVAGFLAKGLMARHLSGLRAEYRRRLETSETALKREFAGTDVSWRTPRGGYFLWLTLDRDRSSERLLHHAIEEGISFVPGSFFSPTGRFPDALRLCFAAARPERLDEGIRRLRRAYDRLRDDG